MDTFKIPSNTRAVFLNIVFFNGSWLEPFATEYTEDMPFILNDKQEQISTTYMAGQQDIDYVEDKDLHLKMIRLPYKENIKDTKSKFAMYVILPNDYNVKDIVRDLSFDKFETLISNMRDETVDVRMPKLDLHTYTDLKKHLDLQNEKLKLNLNVKYRLASNAPANNRLILTNIFQEVRLQVFETGNVIYFCNF